MNRLPSHGRPNAADAADSGVGSVDPITLLPRAFPSDEDELYRSSLEDQVL